MEAPLLRANNEATDYSSLNNYQQLSYPFAFALNSIEFAITLVQVVAATVVLNQVKGEHQESTWIIVCTCACIANLPILCWRFWQIHNPLAETSVNAVMFRLKMLFEYFFVGWFLAFLWYFVHNSSSLDHTNDQLYWLCVAFLAVGCIRYVFPIMICTTMCVCACITFC